ncbi:LysM peptidoglycan-binding domain-containing protein [Bacillus sp. V3B]|uniref:cell division suppressor protein YneA n=1 Tax=Bacillus sp. V3B TaxID=2804915 RepID=UPI00210F0D87|nr:LysM peptidoglycan-binding domain-containing protein [Bacillus sp. V3B]MCQ6276285.1 LysM peptidoglycan-binding domain-containing protein [Bacillus sp. V3B]
MKKLWKNYSYAIILVVLTMIALWLIKINVASSPEHYMTITVMDGDSLWGISQKYESQHGLTEKEFVEWVEQYNGIYGDNIFSGDNLVIPIKYQPVDRTDYHDLASQ